MEFLSQKRTVMAIFGENILLLERMEPHPVKANH